jgi:hypothetical protein
MEMQPIIAFTPRMPLPGAPPPAASEPPPSDRFTPSAREARAADEALVRHACGDACGCLGSMSGDDPLMALEARDAEVRTHEMQHYTTAGDAALGAPCYELVTASNGRSYAVAGHVKVDCSEIPGDPRKTIEKMERVWRAALAPATPSAQDQRVAADASSKLAAARAQLRETGE